MLFFHHIWDNSGYISITQLYMELLLVGGDWNMDNMPIEIVDLAIKHGDFPLSIAGWW